MIHLGHGGEACSSYNNDVLYSPTFNPAPISRPESPDGDEYTSEQAGGGDIPLPDVIEVPVNAAGDTNTADDMNAADELNAAGRATRSLRLSSIAGIYTPPSGSVPHPHGATEMTIIDKSGIHRVWVRFCNCSNSIRLTETHFLEVGLFPTSFKSFKTAFTFWVLDDYRLSNMECHTSAYHYFKKLRRLTSPIFPDAVEVRYC